MESLAKKLNISTPKDWGKVTVAIIIENGGRSILKKYNGSLKEALISIFPDVSWQSNWFKNVPKYSFGHWKKKEKQREFFDSLLKELNIKHPSDWGKVTNLFISQKGGKSLLAHFRGSLFNALSSIYPGSLSLCLHDLEISWNKAWFQHLPLQKKGYWRDKQNQRNFFDALQKELSIQNPEDWGKITRLQLKKSGASTLINHYYPSLFGALRSIYPGFITLSCL